MEILELVVIVGVPLALGLLWNQWAGGASGFLMGTFYALFWASSFQGISGSGTVLLAYILSPMLISEIYRTVTLRLPLMPRHWLSSNNRLK